MLLMTKFPTSQLMYNLLKFSGDYLESPHPSTLILWLLKQVVVILLFQSNKLIYSSTPFINL